MATVGTKLTPAIPVLSQQEAAGLAATSGRLRNALFAQRMVLVLIDIFSVWCSGLIAVALRFPELLRNHWAIETHAAFLVLYSGLIVLFCNTQELYSCVHFRSSRQESIAVTRAVAMASIFLTAFIYFSGLKTISRFVIMFTIGLSLAAIATSRCIRRRKLQEAVADGFTCRNVLIIGTGSAAQAVYRYLREHRYLGYVPTGYITAEADDEVQMADDVLGSLRNLSEIARARFIDEVIISVQNRAAAKLAIAEARACGLGVRVIPDLYDGVAWGAPVEYVGQFPMICLDQQHIPAVALMIKRAMDVTWSAAALLVLSPLIGAVALAIKLNSQGPVLYTSDRVGRKGKVFGCHKFRTMVQDADQMRANLQHLNERDGVLFKIANDPRTTRVGRFLRKYSLDELPQLWNVLRGDMSLVGPRPPLAAEVRQYELDHLRRLDVMPGITGLWQVEARSNPSFASYIALDMEYVDRWNLLLDLRILLKTAAVVVAGTGR